MILIHHRYKRMNFKRAGMRKGEEKLQLFKQPQQITKHHLATSHLKPPITAGVVALPSTGGNCSQQSYS